MGSPVIILNGLTAFIERGGLDPAEWTKTKRGIAEEMHRKIMAGTPRADEDPHVKWNFRENWRVRPLPVGAPFGSYYDFWSDVVNEAFRLWDTHSRNLPMADYIADSIAKQGTKEWSRGFYAAGFGVWQRGVKMERTSTFEGPYVDVGPTADFSAFLERWTYSQTVNKGKVEIYHRIGVMNFIMRELERNWRGMHTIFLMPVRLKDRSSIDPTPNRKAPVITFPIIRIAPFSYRRK